MSEDELPGTNACCESAAVCIFSKALLARAAVCERAARRSVGEREIVECDSVVARTNCSTLAALLHERARFALHLPAPGHPVIHAQAMRLHCGGLKGLQNALEVQHPDVHVMVGAAQQRYGSLMDLPWSAIVRDLVDWKPYRRRTTTPR